MEAAPQASGYWLRERWPDEKILNDLGADVIYDRDRQKLSNNLISSSMKRVPSPLVGILSNVQNPTDQDE